MIRPTPHFLLGPGVAPHGDDHFKISPTLDEQNLRSFLLYCPNIVYVPYFFSSPFHFSMNLVQEEALNLIYQNIIKAIEDRQVSTAKLNSKFFDEEAKILLLSANKNAPDIEFVSLRRISKVSQFGEADSIFITIFDLLPTPSLSAPIPSILEFRENNLEKLTRFHSHILNIGDALSSGSLLAVNHFESLKSDLNEISSALSKANLFGGKVDFSFSTTIQAGIFPAIGTILAQNFGIDPIIGGLFGSTFSIVPQSLNVGRGNNHFPRVFEYIIDANKNRIFYKPNESGPPNDWLYKEAQIDNITVPFTLPPVGTPLILPGKNITVKNYTQFLTPSEFLEPRSDTKPNLD